MRSTQRMTFTRCSFQRGSRPAVAPRPMAAASRAVGAQAIRRCTAGAAPNFAAWYKCSDVENVHGPAAMGAASGAKLLNSPHAARVNRNGQTSSCLYMRMPSSSVAGGGLPAALRASPKCKPASALAGRRRGRAEAGRSASGPAAKKMGTDAEAPVPEAGGRRKRTVP